jgi:ArsR family transcriptional regulator, virulence genes transcriptional regulator
LSTAAGRGKSRQEKHVFFTLHSKFSVYPVSNQALENARSAASRVQHLPPSVRNDAGSQSIDGRWRSRHHDEILRSMSSKVPRTTPEAQSDEPQFGKEFAGQMYAAATNAAQLLRSIGSEHRLMILCTLMDGSKTVTEICNAVGARQSLISQHLTRLRLGGLVKVEREGHFAHYSIDDPLVREIVTALHKRFCANITTTKQ